MPLVKLSTRDYETLLRVLRNAGGTGAKVAAFKKATVPGAAGGARPFVVITAVTDAENYVGNVVTSPTDPKILETAVAIKSDGATANEFAVGYDSFADPTEDAGVTTYWLDGRLLG